MASCNVHQSVQIRCIMSDILRCTGHRVFIRVHGCEILPFVDFKRESWCRRNAINPAIDPSGSFDPEAAGAAHQRPCACRADLVTSSAARRPGRLIRRRLTMAGQNLASDWLLPRRA